MEVKNPLKSKTLWMNLLFAISALFIPAVGLWMGENVELMAMIWSGLNMLLRLITKDKIGIES